MRNEIGENNDSVSGSEIFNKILKDFSILSYYYFWLTISGMIIYHISYIRYDYDLILIKLVIPIKIML